MKEFVLPYNTITGQIQVSRVFLHNLMQSPLPAAGKPVIVFQLPSRFFLSSRRRQNGFFNEFVFHLARLMTAMPG